MEHKTLYRNTWYSCPVCNKSYDDQRSARKCLVTHDLIEHDFIGCNICGEGWNAKIYGIEKALELARNCIEEHRAKGEVEFVANRTYFLSHGERGFIEG